MTLTKAERLTERETILRWDGHKDLVSFFTASDTVARKVSRVGYQPLPKSHQGAWFYKIPYKDLRWGVRPRKTGPAPRDFRGKKAILDASPQA